MANDKQFKPQEHLTKIKGRDYLEVKWRLVWFRQEYPLDSGWGIRTIAEELTEQRAVYHAQVVSPEGLVIAEGTKSETPQGFDDYIEKAETGAIGRALAICGYGTQFCGGELNEGKRIVDSPVDREPTTEAPKQKASKPQKPDTETLGKEGAAKFREYLDDMPDSVQRQILQELPDFLAHRHVEKVADIPKARGRTLQAWAMERAEQIPEEQEQAQHEEYLKIREQAEQMGIPLDGLDTADDVREEIDRVEQAQEVPA